MAFFYPSKGSCNVFSESLYEGHVCAANIDTYHM